MANNWLELELDTTAPILDIYTPQYVKRDLLTEFIIYSNEEISTAQEIYLIDSQSKRYDLNFHLENEKKLIGLFNFHGFPIGICHLYCRLSDKLGNKTCMYIKKILVITSSDSFNITIDKIDYRELKIKRNIKSKIKINSIKRQVNIQNQIIKLNLKEEKMKVILEKPKVV